MELGGVFCVRVLPTIFFLDALVGMIGATATCFGRTLVD
jgi:hypothetical protein